MGVCLVEDWGFRPGGVHSHFLPHNLYSFPVHIVGIPGEVSAPGQLSGFHQAAQKSFSGAFQNSNPNLHFYCLPHQHISLFKNQAPSKVKCHRTAFCRDQTVTERPVRPRVSAPAIVEILAYVFMCHTPVTLIKSTYLLSWTPTGQSRVWHRCFGPKNQFLLEMVQKGSDGPKMVKVEKGFVLFFALNFCLCYSICLFL